MMRNARRVLISEVLVANHPDWTGPDDLEIKSQELREITNWENSYMWESWCCTKHY